MHFEAFMSAAALDEKAENLDARHFKGSLVGLTLSPTHTGRLNIKPSFRIVEGKAVFTNGQGPLTLDTKFKVLEETTGENGQRFVRVERNDGFSFPRDFLPAFHFICPRVPEAEMSEPLEVGAPTPALDAK